MMDGKYSPTKNIGCMRDPDQGTDFPACPPKPGWIWEYGATCCGVVCLPTNSRPLRADAYRTLWSLSPWAPEQGLSHVRLLISVCRIHEQMTKWINDSLVNLWPDDRVRRNWHSELLGTNERRFRGTHGGNLEEEFFTGLLIKDMIIGKYFGEESCE